MSNLPEPEGPAKALAVKLSQTANSMRDHLIGVLLTHAEACIPDDRQLKAFKSLLRRELYNDGRDLVLLIHSIVDRAEVSNFREHPTLEEQMLQPRMDSIDFGNKV